MKLEVIAKKKRIRKKIIQKKKFYFIVKKKTKNHCNIFSRNIEINYHVKLSKQLKQKKGKEND